jgi:hypothetical protein
LIFFPSIILLLVAALTKYFCTPTAIGATMTDKPPTSTTTSTAKDNTPATSTGDDNGEEGELKAPPQPVNRPSGDATSKEEGYDLSADVDDHQHCNLCCNSPCLLEEGLYEELALAYELGLDPDFTFLTNKEIRFRLYRHATSWIHGYLGKDNRIELPQCVTKEIRHLAPESSGLYIGFKKRRIEDESNPQDDH